MRNFKLWTEFDKAEDGRDCFAVKMVIDGKPFNCAFLPEVADNNIVLIDTIKNAVEALFCTAFDNIKEERNKYFKDLFENKK
jgi:hypothetical protein